ncbi:alanine--glyoxylate aminotransferase 2-like [Ceratina calcarata]|uniref:Alanine--glyoxylate aminotransferase 2-like n=1 Tax=Ceratina calcarata TaxID=156304 RepID=A0AAJ7WBD1_9HYME|nr:alanine--glyoxylate aminotransferase 2-like [Ceratina calcarata]
MAESLEQMPKSETIRLRERYIGQACKLFYKSNPLKIVRAEKQYMYDEKGNEYLDCINNVAHVGHCHPTVVRAGQQQMALLSTNNRFLHDDLVICARRLTSMLPEPLSICFLVNSGSEANDLALRLAQTHTKNKDIITLDHAYHGHLTSMIDISPYKFNKPNGPGKKDWVHVVRNLSSLKNQYARVMTLKYRKREELCKILDYRHVREAGGVCIADEVQVGFGRVGSHAWAFQLYGEDVVPDIVTVGKPMGNGHPVAAVITTPAIAGSFKDTGIEYFNTYGGNPVSCAIANAVMEVMERENLQQNADEVGKHLMAELKKLASRRKIVGDVRGVGLFAGIELVLDRVKRTPATAEAKYVVSRMKDRKILISSDGPDDNILKVKPPMVFTIENVNDLVSTLDEVLGEVDIEKEYEPATTILKATISQMDVETEKAACPNGKPVFVRAN